MARLKNITIASAEIIENEKIVNGELFIRYYHENKFPTRYFASRSGKIYSEISDIIMKPTTNQGNYLLLGLVFETGGPHVYVQVHKIIATVWCGGYHETMVVDHIDGDRQNNNADNLQWVTMAENCKRAWDNGQCTKRFGDNNQSTIFSDNQIKEACSMMQNGISIKETSEITGVSIETLHNIIGGRGRQNIAKDYIFPSSIKKGPHSPLPENYKIMIKLLYHDGIPIKDIQEILELDSYSKVVHAIYDNRYKNK